MDLSLYPEFPRAEGKVIPFEGAYLAPTQTGGEFEEEKFKAVVLLSLDQQPLDFFRGQHLHIPGFNRWEAAAISWIAEKELFRNGLVQCGMEGSVDTPNSLVGQSL